MIEIYQNCNVFNDGAFDAVRGKGKDANQIRLEHGEPIRFGADGERGVVRGPDGRLRVADVTEVGEDALVVHDADDPNPSHAFALAHLAERPTGPTPIGVFRASERPIYAEAMGRGARGRPRGRRRRRPDRAAPLRRHLDRRVAVGATDPDGQAQQLDQPPERRTLGAKGGNGRRVPLWTRSGASRADGGLSLTRQRRPLTS